VGQVAAGGQAHAQDGVAGGKQGEEDGLVGLRPGMRLHVGETAAEQELGPLDGQRLGDVHLGAAAVIAPARITLGVFVGENRTLRLQHRARDDVLAGDQLDAVLLAGQFAADDGGQFGVGFRQRGVEEAASRRGVVHHLVPPGGVNLARRASWRPPS